MKIYNKMQKDKVLHTIVGGTITMVTASVLFYLTHIPIILCPLIGFLMGVLAGIFKEYIWDRAWGRGVFNIWDLIYTAWGSLIGFVVFAVYANVVS